MQDEVTVYGLIVVPLKGWKIFGNNLKKSRFLLNKLLKAD